MTQRWTSGNDIRLLDNGEEFFPAVFARIAEAKTEVLIETFILFEDPVGLELHAALVAAARRGVQVDLTVDSYGSPDLSEQFIRSLCGAGVRLHVFDPGPRLFGVRLGVLRRMHRKIVVVDGAVAFVGGINYSEDHLRSYGPEGKQDYSVEVRGPLVTEIRRFALAALAYGQNPAERRRWWQRRQAVREALDEHQTTPAAAGDAEAILVVRDNRRHHDDIERRYRAAIRTARERVVIANAYFFPGYRLIRAMRRAARRGVDVRLVLQGEPDMPIVKTAAEMLYHHLVDAGVKVYEYTERPLHGKVALVDREWATVGSSNLDPLSLALNLEANVIVRSEGFNGELFETLDRLIEHSCKRVEREALGELRWWHVVRSVFVFHFMRNYPDWARWLPRHAPRLTAPSLGDEAGSLEPGCAAMGHATRQTGDAEKPPDLPLIATGSGRAETHPADHPGVAAPRAPKREPA